MAPAATTPRRRDDVVLRQLDDQWVIFDPSTDRLHTLNLTAALVWTHLTGALTTDGIANEVAGAFGSSVAIERVREDVASAIERFRAEGLLQRSV